jgi:hypothetical protein
MKILLLAIMLLFLAACSEQAPYHADEDGFVIPREEPDEPEEDDDDAPEEIIAEDTEEPQEVSHFTVHDDGIIEINLTKFLGSNDIGSVRALDGRHVAAFCTSTYNIIKFSVVDLEEQRIVYTEKFPGNLRRMSDGIRDGGIYIYSAVEVTREPEYTEEYSITFIYPDSSRTESHGGEWMRTVMSNRILRHINGGIYEDIDGELIELLPPNEDFDHFDEDGNWRPNFGAVWHIFREQLDENRFIYNKGGYEWTWGFGVYDFESGQYTNMPDTNSLYVMGVSGNLVFTQFSDLSAPFGIFATNIDTLETIYFLNDDDFPRKELPWEEADERWTLPVLNSFVLSPDKQLIAVTDYDLNIYIICAGSGELKETLSVDVLYKGDTATNSIYVDFLGNDRVIVYDQKWYMRDQRALIIPLERN